ncbi:MAG: YnbE family lipoprotein [Rhodovibrionaceae bacterium]
MQELKEKRAERPEWQAPIVAAAALGAIAACTPTVKMEAPDKPITVNLNIKLDADVRVRLEEQAREDINKNQDIF